MAILPCLTTSHKANCLTVSDAIILKYLSKSQREINLLNTYPYLKPENCLLIPRATKSGALLVGLRQNGSWELVAILFCDITYLMTFWVCVSDTDARLNIYLI
ncbi:hypothetical protein [Xenorhabdus thailandensis]|uniref:hypothetical protein n=1 Tax=Xenorhabdus thailandensis TaxID=3136255 RepID=UPI0030F43F9A